MQAAYETLSGAVRLLLILGVAFIGSAMVRSVTGALTEAARSAPDPLGMAQLGHPDAVSIRGVTFDPTGKG